MDTQIVAVFCLSGDMLKALHHHEDSQSQITDAEVMTTAIVAALYFRGNIENARRIFKDRAIFRICWAKAASIVVCIGCRFVLTLFSLLGETWKELNAICLCGR